MIHVVNAKACGHYELALTFSDGTKKRVNIAPLLHGPVFEPLRDPLFFNKVQVDPVTGTVAWPNDTDLAPEALRDLPALPGSADCETARV
jgi:hypothetical protein